MMTDKPPSEDQKMMGRRRFLKSVFGLGALAETTAPQAQASTSHHHVSIFWANLHNGQVGFPTGTTVPSGQPGSLMKLVTAAALQQAGLFTHDETIECRGIIEIKRHTYKCLYPHGEVGITKAIGLSCNVFFAQAAQKLSPSTLIEYARHFGLDTPVAGYKAESFPKKPTGDTAQYALGLASDLKPNALQLLRLAALVGLHGAAPALHNPGEMDQSEKPFALDLHASTWHTLEQGMRIAGRQGTAKKLDPKDELQLAVKTGTAPHGKTFQSWIAGYWPFEKPHYAFCLRAPSGTSQEQAVPEAHSFLFSCEWP